MSVFSRLFIHSWQPKKVSKQETQELGGSCMQVQQLPRTPPSFCLILSPTSALGMRLASDHWPQSLGTRDLSSASSGTQTSRSGSSSSWSIWITCFLSWCELQPRICKVANQASLASVSPGRGNTVQSQSLRTSWENYVLFRLSALSGYSVIENAATVKAQRAWRWRERERLQMTATLDTAIPDVDMFLVVLLHNQLIAFAPVYATLRPIYIDFFLLARALIFNSIQTIERLTERKQWKEGRASRPGNPWGLQDCFQTSPSVPTDLPGSGSHSPVELISDRCLEIRKRDLTLLLNALSKLALFLTRDTLVNKTLLLSKKKKQSL